MDNPIVRKGRDGWKAENRYDFDGDYKLTISTSKRVGQVGVISTASVSQHKEGWTSHAIGLGMGGDYSERLIVRPTRCTEKSVAAQHLEALAMLDNVVAAAKAHYAKFPIPDHRK